MALLVYIHHLVKDQVCDHFVQQNLGMEDASVAITRSANLAQSGDCSQTGRSYPSGRRSGTSMPATSMSLTAPANTSVEETVADVFPSCDVN